MGFSGRQQLQAELSAARYNILLVYTGASFKVPYFRPSPVNTLSFTTGVKNKNNMSEKEWEGGGKQFCIPS